MLYRNRNMNRKIQMEIEKQSLELEIILIFRGNISFRNLIEYIETPNGK